MTFSHEELREITDAALRMQPPEFFGMLEVKIGEQMANKLADEIIQLSLDIVKSPEDAAAVALVAFQIGWLVAEGVRDAS